MIFLSPNQQSQINELKGWPGGSRQ